MIDDPYKFDIYQAITYISNAKDGTSLSPLLMRVPQKASMSIDPLRVQFYEDPKHMGFDIYDLYASDIAKEAQRLKRKVDQLENDLLHTKERLLDTEKILAREIRIVGMYESFTSIMADDMFTKYNR